MRVATVSEVLTPWLCLQEDLRQAGIDPVRLDRVADGSTAKTGLTVCEIASHRAASFADPRPTQLASTIASPCGSSPFDLVVGLPLHRIFRERFVVALTRDGND
jgi:hypothetical protein